MSVNRLYEEMDAASVELLEAARRSDWQAFAAMEKKVTALRVAMEQGPQTRCSPQDTTQRVELLRAILSRLDEADRHVKPWLAALRELRDGYNAKGRVDRAYATASR